MPMKQNPERRFTAEFAPGTPLADDGTDLCVTVFDRYAEGVEVTEDRKKWVVYARCGLENAEEIVSALNLQHDVVDTKETD